MRMTYAFYAGKCPSWFSDGVIFVHTSDEQYSSAVKISHYTATYVDSLLEAAIWHDLGQLKLSWYLKQLIAVQLDPILLRREP